MKHENQLFVQKQWVKIPQNSSIVELSNNNQNQEVIMKKDVPPNIGAEVK